jgi:hypothetical protein
MHYSCQPRTDCDGGASRAQAPHGRSGVAVPTASGRRAGTAASHNERRQFHFVREPSRGGSGIHLCPPGGRSAQLRGRRSLQRRQRPWLTARGSPPVAPSAAAIQLRHHAQRTGVARGRASLARAAGRPVWTARSCTTTSRERAFTSHPPSARGGPLGAVQVRCQGATSARAPAAGRRRRGREVSFSGCVRYGSHPARIGPLPNPLGRARPRACSPGVARALQSVRVRYHAHRCRRSRDIRGGSSEAGRPGGCFAALGAGPGGSQTLPRLDPTPSTCVPVTPWPTAGA